MKHLIHQIAIGALLSASVAPLAGHDYEGLSDEQLRQVKKHHQSLSRGKDVETSIQVLNLYDEKPEVINELYRYSFNFLKTAENPTMAALAADEGFQKKFIAAGMTHLGGPILGNISPTSADIWVRTAKPSSVKVIVQTPDGTKEFGPIQSTVEEDLAAVVSVDGLIAGTSYPYAIYADDQKLDIPEGAAIRTVGADNQITRIGFGSCQHRWGLGNHHLTELMLERDVEALLQLGDIAVQDRRKHFGLHRADYFMRDLQIAWQDLAAQMPMYANWDDHDYIDNDQAGVPKGYTNADRKAIRQVFKESWVNPYYGDEEAEQGIHFNTRIGPVEVIMTDNRYYRKKKSQKDAFLGTKQMRWLKERLRNSDAPFIILSCGTMWGDTVSGGKDSWGKFDPAGRESILRMIEEEQIPGVLLISGDRHGARGFKMPRESGFTFYEFGGASLGARIGAPAHNENWEHQTHGLVGEAAYNEFTFDLSKPDPTVTFRLIREDGYIIHEMELTRSQLTPSGAEN